MLRSRRALRADVERLEQRLDHERLYPVHWANRRVRDQFGNAVRSGPFAGLRYPDWAMTEVDAFAPKVLGSFERELQGAVESAVARRPGLVVNVGAAEGYYAVGLALRLPHARVVAFEPRQTQAGQLREIARLNQVSVDIEAASCTPERLAETLDDGALLLCDCDGCEDTLLDPGRVPALTGCEIIVEAHDLLVPGVTSRLEQRFAASHRIDRIHTTPRFVSDFPALDFMPLVTQQLAISEFREGPMWWLTMRPS